MFARSFRKVRQYVPIQVLEVLCDSSLSPALSGKDTSAALDCEFKLIWKQCQDEICREKAISYIRYAAGITTFCIEFEPLRRLPNPAPPPKLHFSTFWRSVAKKIFHKRAEERILSARALSPKLENKSIK